MRGAIFDLDDTLYRYEEFVASGFHAVSQHVATLCDRGAGEALALLQRFRGGPERGQELQALCGAFDLSPALVPRLLHVFRAHRPRVSLAHDAAPTLRRLRTTGWRLGILTNGPASIQRRKVRVLGVEALVDAVVYAEEHAPGGKPAAAAFAAVTRALGVECGRAVMVGNDLECDVRGAERAGLRAIHVQAPSDAGVPARHVRHVADLSDVPALLERLVPAEAVHVH